jgi:choline dehydrogenase-like flavoprotein
MYIDGRKIPDSQQVEHDLCIIGAGAAGISIALQFIATKQNVCVLESGGFEFNARQQELYTGTVEGENSDPNYLTKTRLRMFGGSTMHWQGYCRPMDSIDFKRKTWVDHYHGWPIQRASLIPYYDKACEIVQINPFFKEFPESLPFIRKDLDIVSLPFHISPPVRFGKKYRPEIGKAKNISTYLFSNAREFMTSSDNSSIKTLKVVTSAGNVFQVKAKRFILCSGGIENPRILLNSNSSIKQGIGNQHDLVGRYFMTHLPMKGFGKAIITSPKAAQITDSLIKPTIHYLSLKEKTKQEKKLLNVGFHLHPGYKFNTPGRHPDNMRNVLPAFDSLLTGNSNYQIFPILAVAEQRPHPENRIELSSSRDYMGMQKLKLRYQYSQLDLNNIHQSAKIFASEIGRLGLGRVQTVFSDDKIPSLSPDDHHMGTTRMNPNPKLGVVDENCKVHGIDNLYIAGSSIFPSCGFANPTLTLIAMALRLTDHLKTL